jgi:hypothetical protein
LFGDFRVQKKCLNYCQFSIEDELFRIYMKN